LWQHRFAIFLVFSVIGYIVLTILLDVIRGLLTCSSNVGEEIGSLFFGSIAFALFVMCTPVAVAYFYKLHENRSLDFQATAEAAEISLHFKVWKNKVLNAYIFSCLNLSLMVYRSKDRSQSRDLLEIA